MDDCDDDGCTVVDDALSRRAGSSYGDIDLQPILVVLIPSVEDTGSDAAGPIDGGCDRDHDFEGDGDEGDDCDSEMS